MKSVVVFSERCVGCMQCMFQCAVAHSKSKDFEAIFEEPLPKPRIHMYPGLENYAFPSKCRHCEPAPCIEACPTSALKREEGIVFVDVDRCINCGMCAMVCPFGVIRFHFDWRRIEKMPVSYKCDGCMERVSEGKDAKMLAHLLRTNLRNPIAAKEVRELRDLRLRKSLIEERNRLKNRVHAILSRNGIFDYPNPFTKKGREYLETYRSIRNG